MHFDKYFTSYVRDVSTNIPITPPSTHNYVSDREISRDRMRELPQPGKPKFTARTPTHVGDVRDQLIDLPNMSIR